MLFLLSSFAVAAQASSLLNFLLKGPTDNNANNNTNTTMDALMKPMGLGSVVALAANNQHGIYAMQADNKLYYKKDLNTTADQGLQLPFPGTVKQLLDLDIALMAMTDDGKAYVCLHPCKNDKDAKWGPVNWEAGFKASSLLHLGKNLGVLGDPNTLLILPPDDSPTQKQPSMGIKHYHYLEKSDYQGLVDKDGRLVLVTRKNGAMKQNFLGEGYAAVLLTESYLYGIKTGQMVTRCKLPCEGDAAKMVDFMSGKDTVLMASYNKNILACNKGAPLVAVAEDN